MHVKSNQVVIFGGSKVPTTAFGFGYQSLVTYDDPEDRLGHEREQVLVEAEYFANGEGFGKADRVEVFLCTVILSRVSAFVRVERERERTIDGAV